LRCLTSRNAWPIRRTILHRSVAGEDVGSSLRASSAHGKCVHVCQGQVYIDQIAVKPRIRGWAAAALIQAVRESGKSGADWTVALDTWAFNDKAQAFFARQGFTRSIYGCGCRLRLVPISDFSFLFLPKMLYA
jgi:GNAT superfamily N-acetyltransferase